MLQPSIWTTSVVMNWFILIVAGLCECGFTFCLGKAKVATGWEATAWYAGFVIVSALSMILLAKASRTVLIGIFVFNEAAGFWRLFFISTLIISIVGLKILS